MKWGGKSMDIGEKTNGLNNYFCLEDDMSTIERFLHLGEKRYYKHGERILQIGEPVTQFYYLRQGRAGRLITVANGLEKYIKVVCEQGIIGEVMFFGGGVNNHAFVAIEDCECYLFDKKVVNEVLLKDEQFVQDLIQWFCRRMSSLNKQVTESLIKAPYYRVCKFLLEFVQTFGKINEKGHYMYEGKLSHYDIARYIGIQRVSVTNVMKQLQAEQIIEKDRKSLVILDAEYLEQL